MLPQEAALAPRMPGVQPSAALIPAQARTSSSPTSSAIPRGFYDGTADGVWGAKTDIAARDFAQAAGLKINIEASDNLLRAIIASHARPAAAAAATTAPDPIAELIAPSKRVHRVQRALADFGYGQIKPTGAFDPETRAAIEKFERDRRLPVTGRFPIGWCASLPP